MNWLMKYFKSKERIPRYLAGSESVESSEDNVDEKVNIHTLYKHRWVWYHMILCIQLIISNVLLVAILIVLAVKL